MLTLAGIECGYGEVRVLHGVSLAVAPGEIVGLLGRNGAGKTTTLRAIMGSVRPRAGSIRLDDTELTGLRPHEIPKRGVAYVPQGRRLFPFLTVAENLRMGLLVRGGDAGTLEEVLELFPVLRERLRQRAGTLSGGEQQMLATARALCARPRILLLDEPTEGLMPALVQRLLETVRSLKARAVGVLLVEQRIDAALAVVDRVVLMETGQVRHEATPAALASNPEVLLRYVGVRR
ncbi:MAG TPA: ABC transporter ATP-binding protein [Methylomirabilota bacterium]|jgi:branched-chain amino acid transport system ATP-binding protein|nr:ABC transporter ATP-binding protein [Methylomirabilota bacterium]